MRGPRLARLVCALLLLGGLASCAYYNTFYLARKYYFRATLGEPYELDREGATQRQNYTKSADYSKKVLGVYPKSKWVDDAWLLWARALLGTDDPLKAVSMLQEFQTRFPNSDLRPDAEFFLGLAYRAARKNELAVASFEAFLGMAARHELAPYAWYERSRALMSLQRYEEAANSAGEVLTRYPRHVMVDRALRQRAEARFQQQAWDGAREDFRTLGSRALTDAERLAFLLREVDCLESKRDYAAAREVLEDTRSHVPPPPPPPPVLRVGANANATAQQYQQFQQAQQQQFPTAIAAGQDSYGRLTLRMGGVELLAGDVDKAVSYFKAVIQDYPRTALAAEAQFRIGFAYETGADDFKQARAEYQRVREQTGTSQFSQQAQSRMDNLERIEAFRSASGQDSVERKSEARFLMAEHYLFNLGRPERALEEYRAIADSLPGTSVAGRALVAQGWLLARRLDRAAEADSLFWLVVRRYPATEAQMAARDYLELAGTPVPESLIVPPKGLEKRILPETRRLPSPPSSTPRLGTTPAAPVDPASVRYGPGAKPGTPGAPTAAERYAGLPDSLRLELMRRDSLASAPRSDSTVVRLQQRADSLARAPRPKADTTGRAAQRAEIRALSQRPDSVRFAPGGGRAPDLRAADSLAVPTRATAPVPMPVPPRVDAPVSARRVVPDSLAAARADSLRARLVRPDSTRTDSVRADSVRTDSTTVQGKKKAKKVKKPRPRPTGWGITEPPR